jgi:hypothetical protein
MAIPWLAKVLKKMPPPKVLREGRYRLLEATHTSIILMASGSKVRSIKLNNEKNSMVTERFWETWLKLSILRLVEN